MDYKRDALGHFAITAATIDTEQRVTLMEMEHTLYSHALRQMDLCKDTLKGYKDFKVESR